MSGLKMKYFVLKPQGDDVYAKASRKAMMSYSREIRLENREFAQELMDWAVSEIPEEVLQKIGEALGDDGQRR